MNQLPGQGAFELNDDQKAGGNGRTADGAERIAGDSRIAETSAVAETLTVAFMRLDLGLPVPRYAHDGDAGVDLPLAADVSIPPGARRLVGTGIAIAIPHGWVGLIHPRSGLAARHGLTIVNTPGTVDSGYRGEIKVCLLNTDLSESVVLHRGDFIAQLVFQRVGRARLVAVSELPSSERGIGGYGSSGGIVDWVKES